MPEIVVISDFGRAFGEGVEDFQMDMFRHRHQCWQRVGATLNCDIELIDSAAVMAEPTRIAGARVCFIDMPLLRQEHYRQLCGHCATHAPNAKILDSPSDVETVRGLERYYHRLRERGLPLIPTALVAIDSDALIAFASEEDVRSALADRMLQSLAEAGIDLKNGLFLRTFYNSVRKPHPAYYFAHTPNELVGTAWRVLKFLRAKNDIGGLALREHIGLASINLPPDEEYGAVSVNCEMRLTIIDGRPRMAAFHGLFEQTAASQQTALRSALRDRQGWFAGLRDLAQQLTNAGMPANLVADIAFRPSGEPVLVELNPLYSSGSFIPAARAWCVANLAAALVAKAGHSPCDAQQTREAALGAPIQSDATVYLWE